MLLQRHRQPGITADGERTIVRRHHRHAVLRRCRKCDYSGAAALEVIWIVKGSRAAAPPRA